MYLVFFVLSLVSMIFCMDFGTVLTVYLVFFVLSLVSMIFYMDFGTVLTVYLVFFVLSLVSMIFYMDFGSVLTGVPHFQFFATRIIKVKIYTKFWKVSNFSFILYDVKPMRNISIYLRHVSRYKLNSEWQCWPMQEWNVFWMLLRIKMDQNKQMTCYLHRNRNVFYLNIFL